MRDHRQLKAFHLCDLLIVEIYRLTQHFPSSEQFGLTSQIRRSAVSVCSNIVEGCARETQNDYLRFLDIAFGSLREMHYQMELSNRLGFLSDQEAHTLLPKINEAEKVLASLIRSLRSGKSNTPKPKT